MSLSKEQQLFTRNVADLILYANCKGVELTFGEVQRTSDQQRLYFNGYTIECKKSSLELVKTKPRSKTMLSFHIKKLAVDFNFFIDGKLVFKHSKINDLGEYWEGLDPKNKWGGNFNSFYDGPHFQRTI